MGTDERSVVDPTFAVRGLTGLRVVDASAMPSNVRSHTHAPVTMPAERAADVLLRPRRSGEGHEALPHP